MHQRGWNDEATETLNRRKRESGLSDRDGIRTIFYYIDADEGRPVVRSEEAGGCVRRRTQLARRPEFLSLEVDRHTPAQNEGIAQILGSSRIDDELAIGFDIQPWRKKGLVSELENHFRADPARTLEL